MYGASTTWQLLRAAAINAQVFDLGFRLPLQTDITVFGFFNCSDSMERRTLTIPRVLDYKIP